MFPDKFPKNKGIREGECVQSIATKVAEENKG